MAKEWKYQSDQVMGGVSEGNALSNARWRYVLFQTHWGCQHRE